MKTHDVVGKRVLPPCHDAVAIEVGCSFQLGISLACHDLREAKCEFKLRPESQSHSSRCKMHLRLSISMDPRNTDSLELALLQGSRATPPARKVVHATDAPKMMDFLAFTPRETAIFELARRCHGSPYPQTQVVATEHIQSSHWL